MKTNINGYYIDLSEVVLIDTTLDEFKIVLVLKNGVKIEKSINKIDPYAELEYRAINNKKDVRSTEIVVQIDGITKAYRKEDVMKVLDREKIAWDNYKKELIKKWTDS